MKCPACKDALVALELDGIEVDWCASCGGVWLDRGELELLGDGPEAADRFLAGLKPVPAGGPTHPAHPTHPTRKCPICSARLMPVESAWAAGTVVDECPKRDGLWFDRDELGRVLEATGLSGQPAASGPNAARVRDFFRDIFKK